MLRLELLLCVAVVLSSGMQTSVFADETPTLTVREVVDQLLSPNLTAHRRGVRYLSENQLDVTSEFPRLIEGLASDARVISHACDTGLRYGKWRPKAMEKHVPQLLELLFNENSHTRFGARNALNRMVPHFKHAVPALIARVQDQPHAVESVLALENRGGLTKKRWVTAWLPLTVNKNTNVRYRSRSEITSDADHAAILVQIADTEQADSMTVAILELLAKFRRKPKRSGALVVRLLGHRSPDVRAAALASLSEIPHRLETARPHLIAMSRMEDEELRAATVSRLYRDPGLGKASSERDEMEEQVAQIIKDAFSDRSSTVRRAACRASRWTKADRVQIAEQLIELLADPDEGVRMSAQGAVSTRVLVALCAEHFDQNKLKRYYLEKYRRQEGSPAAAQARLMQMMSELPVADAANRELLRSVEDSAENHAKVEVRNVLRRFLSDELREQARSLVPENLRAEERAK